MRVKLKLIRIAPNHLIDQQKHLPTAVHLLVLAVLGFVLLALLVPHFVVESNQHLASRYHSTYTCAYMHMQLQGVKVGKGDQQPTDVVAVIWVVAVT